MDVWSIRLSVLRKVPPLLLALEDAEIALRSGWNTINNPGSQNEEDAALSRETFGIMRKVLQDKVTTLGQDLDYLLDALEGREDTLPESWLDRMEEIEQDYGEWVVAGDRKVREGEWAKMAKLRQEAEEARKLKEAAAAKAAEEAEKARRKVQQEAEEARAAEVSKRKAEQEAEEAERARLEAVQDAEDARLADRQRVQMEAERKRAADEARRKTEQEAEEAETARQQALQDAEDARNREFAKQRALREAEEAQAAETAKRKTEQEAEEAERVRQKAPQVSADAHNAEIARQRTQKEAEEAGVARLQAMNAAEHAHNVEIVRQQAQQEAEQAEAAENAKGQAEKEAEDLERQQAQRDAEASSRIQSLRDAEEAVRAQRHAQPDAEHAENARLQAKKEAEDAEMARSQAVKESAEAAARIRQAQMELEEAKALEAATLKVTQDAQAQAQVYQQQAEVQAVQVPEQTSMGITASTVAVPTIAAATGIALATALLKSSSTSANLSKIFPFDGNDSGEPGQILRPSITISGSQYDGADCSIIRNLAEELHEESSLASLIHFESPPQRSPSTITSPITEPKDSRSSESSRSPQPGQAMANSILCASTPKLLSDQRPSSQDSTKRRKSLQPNDILVPREADSVPQSPTRSLFNHGLPVSQTEPDTSNDTECIVFESNKDMSNNLPPTTQSFVLHVNRSSATDGSRSKRHSRNISVITGYSSTEPTPEIHEEEPAEYFRPSISPVMTTRTIAAEVELMMHSRLPDILPRPMSGEAVRTFDGSETPTKSLDVAQMPDGAQNMLSLVHEEKIVSSSITGTSGDECEVCDGMTEETALEDPVPVLTSKASIIRIDGGVKDISIPSPRRSSISSDTPTFVNGQGNDAPSSSVGSPTSLRLEAFPEVDESPTAGRIGHRKGTSYDYSPPDSPSRPAFPKRPSLNLEQNPSGSDLAGPLTPLDAPVFDEIDLSPAPVSSPKKANSDEQLQKQISTLLESIPARIRLTSELEPNPFSSKILQPKKTRRSITPSFRPSSSMSNYSTSSRAPTPSFTLAPAFSKTNHRSRMPGNPEIKLYHLSRSTGEAPIKLFVRLVGEHGERVMVRVGGGWADLGEYLKEYASHHGRRTAADNDRIEIQDLPPRVVSSSSTISSSATIRGNGRDSPIFGPHGVLEKSTERPGSSLKVRKTRKSVEETESRANDVRSPSTPLPNYNRLSYETPPSVAGSEASSASTGPSFRSSSRLSWTDEDTSLGLAGPKSKKVAISERDQEWVESMKEKVRQASAEKERKNKERESIKESQRKTSFGEMDRIGGTKRLFRKGGA